MKRNDRMFRVDTDIRSPEVYVVEQSPLWFRLQGAGLPRRPLLSLGERNANFRQRQMQAGLRIPENPVARIAGTPEAVEGYMSAPHR